MPLAEWQRAVRAERPPRLRDRLRRVLLRDLLRRAKPPLGALQAAQRSSAATTSAAWWCSPACPSARNVPGMRSGFVAGDAAILKQFLLYRTYHGSAMSPAGAGAPASPPGATRRTCVDNRDAVPREVRRGHAAARRRCWTSRCPTPASTSGLRDAAAATTSTSRAACCAQYNVTVLPGSLLAREAHGVQPGRRPRPHGAGRRAGRMRRGRAAASSPICPNQPLNDRTMTQQLQNIIDPPGNSRAEHRRPTNAPEVRDAVEQRHRRPRTPARLRVAESRASASGHVNQWVKKAVLL